MRSLLTLALVPLALADSLTLHHRISTPSSSSSEWLPLGTIQTDYTASGRVQLDPSTQSSGAKLDLSDDAVGEGAWYQVGIETEEGWVYGSTRACFLFTPPRVQIHLSHDTPTSISIKTNAPTSGTCPPVTAGGLTISPLGIKVDVHRPILLAGPNAAAPPTAQATNPNTGLPEAPPPEKTFLQKYWLPLLGIGVFIIGQMTAPDQGQGQARGGATAAK